jgi:hypothetical protein
MTGDAGPPGDDQPRSGTKSIAELLNDTLVPQLEDTHIEDGGAKKKKKKKKKKTKAKAPVVKCVRPRRR